MKRGLSLLFCSLLLSCASAPPGREEVGANQIRSVDLSKVPTGWEVIVEGSRPPAFTLFEIDRDQKIVIDLASSVWVGGDSLPLLRDTDIGVKLFPLGPELGEVVRVEVTLAKPMLHEARVEGNNVILFLEDGSAIEGGSEPGEVVGEGGEESSGEALPSIRSVQVEGEGDFAEIRFQSNAPFGRFHSFELQEPPRLVIDLPRYQLQTEKQGYPVGKGGVKRVRLGSSEKGVRLVLDAVDRFPPYQIYPEGDQLVVLTGPRVARAEKILMGPPSSEARREEPSGVSFPEASSVEGRGGTGGDETPSPEEAEDFSLSRRGEERGYVGEKISLDLKDADIQNVLRLLAEVSQLNIIAGEDVQGRITMRLVDIPWDQALDVILESSGLGQKRMGNVIRIAPLETLRQEEEMELEALRSKERLEELMMEVIAVNYADAEELQEQLKPLLSERGSLQVDARTNTIIIKDIGSVIRTSRELVARLDQPTPQVMIEARIVQVTSNLAEELGIQWGGSYGKGDVSVTGGNSGDAGSPTTPDFVVNLPTPSTPAGSLGILLGSVGDTALLDLRLSALESTGKAKIISTPRVAMLDNREATIQQGVTIPFETTSSLGTTTIFVDATLTLKVTPHITADRSVIMNITVERNAPDPSIDTQGAGPAISKRSATTEVLVKDRETTVIGGIFEVTDTTSVTQVPFLGRIPGIGFLFRRKVKTQDKSELLVFITPKVISPPPRLSSDEPA